MLQIGKRTITIIIANITWKNGNMVGRQADRQTDRLWPNESKYACECVYGRRANTVSDIISTKKSHRLYSISNMAYVLGSSSLHHIPPQIYRFQCEIISTNAPQFTAINEIKCFLLFAQQLFDLAQPPPTHSSYVGDRCARIYIYIIKRKSKRKNEPTTPTKHSIDWKFLCCFIVLWIKQTLNI